MLSYTELNELLKTIGASNVREFQLEIEGMKLHVKSATEVVTEASAVQAINKAYDGNDATSELVHPASADTISSVVTQSRVDLVSDDDQDKLHQIVSPMVGTFYHAPSPDKDPFVNIGDQVSENTVVCIVEAMKLMNELEAECRGEIVEIMVENGQLVEYGQPLFKVRSL